MTSRNYEGMFILDNNAATADFEATSGQVDTILEKHGASIVVKEKWDDRKLAYEIKGRRRGTYYLTYFQADPASIEKIAEDVHLTEDIIRHMVIVLDMPIEGYIETRNKERELLAEDSRKNSLGGWGDRRRPGGRPGGAGRGRGDDDDGDDDDDSPAPRRRNDSSNDDD
jgi:small subunit ribosomal protein S6